MDTDKFYIDDDYVSTGLYGRPLFFRCETIHKGHWGGEIETYQCGGESHYTVTYWLPLSEQWHTKHVCKRCLDEAKSHINPDRFVSNN